MASEQQMQQPTEANEQQKQMTARGNVQESPENEQNTEKNAEMYKGLPMESSPYLRYTDLEDYKRNGYGTEGHLDPKFHRGTGTDAPTVDGSRGISAQEAANMLKSLE